MRDVVNNVSHGHVDDEALYGKIKDLVIDKFAVETTRKKFENLSIRTRPPQRVDGKRYQPPQEQHYV